MGALVDLWKSERGLVMVALIIAATVLAVTGHIEIPMWVDYTKWIFGIYVAGKTVTGTVAIARNSTADDADRSASMITMLGDLFRGLSRDPAVPPTAAPPPPPFTQSSPATADRPPPPPA